MDDWLVLALVVIVGALAISVVAVLVILKQNRIQRAMPEVRIEATLLSLSTEVGTKSSSQWADGSTSSSEVIIYYAEFLLPNRKKLKFKVKKRVHYSFKEGTKGTLVYQGFRFIQFIPHAQGGVK